MSKAYKPKPRIPVAPPSIRHKSAKDYVRVKKVKEDIESYEAYWNEDFEDCSEIKTGWHEENLMFLLRRFGIRSAITWRIVSYG